MRFGASMSFTDDSMTPTALALALEERGFDAVWAPEDIDTLRRYRDRGRGTSDPRPLGRADPPALTSQETTA